MIIAHLHSQRCKGVAILSVILCHAAGTFGHGKIVLFTPLGGIGVSIFLLLSAYGLIESWQKLAKTNTGGRHISIGGGNDLSQYGFHTSSFN